MAERGTAMGAVVFLFQSQSQFSHRVNEDFLRVEDRTVWLRPTHRNTVCVCARVCVSGSAVSGHQHDLLC